MEDTILLLVVGDDAYNALVCTRFAPELGRERVHQLATNEVETRYEASREWRGKIVIGEDMNFQRLADLMEAGALLMVEPYQAVTNSPSPVANDGWLVAVVRHGCELAFLGAEARDRSYGRRPDRKAVQSHACACCGDEAKALEQTIEAAGGCYLSQRCCVLQCHRSRLHSSAVADPLGTTFEPGIGG